MARRHEDSQVQASASFAADEAVEKQRRDLVRHGIDDVQGSTRGNDTKCSAGLIVHGILFTGVLTLSKDLGPVFSQAASWQRTLSITLVAIATVLLIASLAYFLRALSPYHPKALADAFRTQQLRVFFPDPVHLTEQANAQNSATELDVFVANLRSMDGEAIVREYAGEIIKIADIRMVQSRLAGRGFLFLGLELVFVLFYVIFIGAVSISQVA